MNTTVIEESPRVIYSCILLLTCYRCGLGLGLGLLLPLWVQFGAAAETVTFAFFFTENANVRCSIILKNSGLFGHKKLIVAFKQPATCPVLRSARNVILSQ